jgi:AcrR family transcriptional regulator
MNRRMIAMKTQATTMPANPREGMPTTGEVILQVAIELFAQRGYHATSMREIAAAVPIRAAGIYHWYESKDAILLRLETDFLDELTDVVASAIEHQRSPASRLAVAVREHVLFHGLSPLAAFVTDSELRALSGEDKIAIQAKRDTYQEMFVEIIRDGVASGVFTSSDVRIASYAILLECTGVAIWFNPSGSRTLEEVAKIHMELVLGSLYVRPSVVARAIREANSYAA